MPFYSDPNLHWFRLVLQPFVTFKGKPEHILKEIKVKKNDVVITTQANGWMNYKLMMRWICKVLVKNTKGHHMLLVFNIFKEHLKEEVLAKLTKNNISYVIIPGCCTYKTQLLDVCLNKLFQTYLLDLGRNEFMVNQA